MKKLLFIFLLICFRASATNYFVANAGSDGAAGTSQGTAWQSISKVNAASLAAGDSVFFKRGDIFPGTISVTHSGSLGNPIYYGAYGSGVNPIVTGFATVGAWTSLGSNIWESTSAISTLNLANVVTVNGVSVPMGRTPNTSGGYLQITNHVGNTQITTGLTGTPNYTGAELVKKDTKWIISRDSITAQSLGTLTYTVGTGLPYVNGQAYNGANNFGFFIQNYLPACDTTNEWFYNRSTKKLDIYSVGSPSATVQVSTIDTLVNCQQHDYITFDNLTFTGANSYAFYFTKSKNISITHCKLDNNYYGIFGINFGSTNSGANFTANLDTINHSSNKALDLQYEFSSASITNNLVRGSGIMPGMGGSGDGQYQGINVTGSGTVISNNEVDSTGYVAIGFRLSNITVSNNYIHTYCFVKDDGGGIYTQGAGSGNVISYNTVLNGIGSLAGTSNFAGFGGNGVSSAYGIYADDATSGLTVSHNTTSGNSNSGIFLHNNNNVSVLNNTSYNNGKNGFIINDNNATTRTGKVVKNNIFFQKDSTNQATFQNLCVSMYSIYNDLGSILTMDSNYFARPINDSLVFDIDPSTSGGTHTLYSLATWQALYGFDTHSHKSPLTVTTTSDLRFDYNPSGFSLPVSLGNAYIDVTGVTYNGSILLNPYSSAALIKSSAIISIPGTYSTIFNHSKKLP